MNNIEIFRKISEDELKQIALFFKKNDYVLIQNVLTDEIKDF